MFIRMVNGCKETRHQVHQICQWVQPHIHEIVFKFCASCITLFSSSFYFDLHYSEGSSILFLYMRSMIWWTLKILHCIIGLGYDIMNYYKFYQYTARTINMHSVYLHQLKTQLIMCCFYGWFDLSDQIWNMNLSKQGIQM